MINFENIYYKFTRNINCRYLFGFFCFFSKLFLIVELNVLIPVFSAEFLKL